MSDMPHCLKGRGCDLVILCCGDRHWNDWKKIEMKLDEHNPYKIIEGEARGADMMCRTVAQQMDISVDQMPADWEYYGKRAGPIRNHEMLKRLLWYRDSHGCDIMVLAFHSDIDKSKGTKHMISIAKKAGVQVELVR